MAGGLDLAAGWGRRGLGLRVGGAVAGGRRLRICQAATARRARPTTTARIMGQLVRRAEGWAGGVAGTAVEEPGDGADAVEVQQPLDLEAAALGERRQRGRRVAALVPEHLIEVLPGHEAEIQSSRSRPRDS